MKRTLGKISSSNGDFGTDRRGLYIFYHISKIFFCQKVYKRLLLFLFFVLFCLFVCFVVCFCFLFLFVCFCFCFFVFLKGDWGASHIKASDLTACRAAKTIHCAQNVKTIRLCTEFNKISIFLICHILCHFQDGLHWPWEFHMGQNLNMFRFF